MLCMAVEKHDYKCHSIGAIHSTVKHHRAEPERLVFAVYVYHRGKWIPGVSMGGLIRHFL